MPLHGCNARVGVSDIQVKCGSTVWTQYMKMFPDSQGKQVFCEKCHQECIPRNNRRHAIQSNRSIKEIRYQLTSSLFWGNRTTSKKYGKILNTLLL